MDGHLHSPMGSASLTSLPVRTSSTPDHVRRGPGRRVGSEEEQRVQRFGEGVARAPKVRLHLTGNERLLESLTS